MTRARTRSVYAGLGGAAFMLVVLLILQSFLGSGLFSTKTVTVTTSDAYEQVSNAYANHLMQLGAGNISALVNGYETNATVEWAGVVVGQTGNYTGSASFGVLLRSTIGKFINFSVSEESQMIGVKSSARVVVNSTLNFHADSAVLGKVNGTIVAQDTYEHVGDSWLISHELWNFTQFNTQYYFGR